MTHGGARAVFKPGVGVKNCVFIVFYRPGTVFRTRHRGRIIGVLDISGDTAAPLGDRGTHRTATVTEFLQPAIYIYIYIICIPGIFIYTGYIYIYIYICVANSLLEFLP